MLRDRPLIGIALCLAACVSEASPPPAVASEGAHGSSCGAIEEPAEEVMPATTLLVQMAAALGRSRFSPDPTALLQSSRPLAWLHVPKTGTSFVNTLIHTVGLCPGIPSGTVVNRTAFCQKCSDYNIGLLYYFSQAYPSDTACRGSFSTGGGYLIGDHHGMEGGLYDATYSGHGVTMMRQPEQRMISSYDHWQSEPAERDETPTNLSAREYAARSQGCAVRMLTRQKAFTHDCTTDTPPTPAEVATAKERLSGFVFVGITSHWDLSVCLFRAMFGGLCYGSDFSNVRARPGEEAPLHDVSRLDGWVDQADGELYEHALGIFAASLLRHGVSQDSCQPCFEHASAHWAP